MNTNFDEIFNIKKAQYIIEKYEEMKHNFRDESEQRLKNMNIDPLTLFKKYVAKSKKGSKKGTKKLMYHTNKIIILVDILPLDLYHFKLYRVRLDTQLQMNIIMILILVIAIRF